MSLLLESGTAKALSLDSRPLARDDRSFRARMEKQQVTSLRESRCLVTLLLLFLHFGGPVEDDRQRCSVGFVYSCINQKFLAVGGDIVRDHIAGGYWLAHVGLKKPD